MSVMQLGFVGLGLMGGGMVNRLLGAGYVPNVFDIDESKVSAFAKLGASARNSLGELTENSQVIFSSLPDPSTVDNVYLGPDGVIESVRPDTILIDMSTVDPETSRNVCRVAAEKGAKYLDAPVSGGPREAETGKLVVIVGGDRDAFDSSKHLLEILGSTVHYAGSSGSGNVVKLVNNIMSMGNVAVAAEAFVLGVKAGADGQTLFNILRTGGGRSHHLEKRFPNVLAGNFEPGFTVDLAKKDLNLALEMAQKASVPMLVTSLVHRLYSTASSIGDGKKDIVAIVKLFESWANVEAREQKKK